MWQGVHNPQVAANLMFLALVTLQQPIVNSRETVAFPGWHISSSKAVVDLEAKQLHSLLIMQVRIIFLFPVLLRYLVALMSLWHNKKLQNATFLACLGTGENSWLRLKMSNAASCV